MGHYFLRSLFLFYLFLNPLPVIASTDPISHLAPVSASIPSLAVTKDTTAPSNPILLRPFDGTVTSDPQPEFAWKESIDNNSNTILYTLYLDGQAVFLGISNLGNSSGVGYTARIEGGEIRLLPTTPLAEGPHDWYITASDLSGNQSHSTSWHFVIDLTPPPLTLTLLNDYPYPTGTSFEFASEQSIYFTYQTESLATVFLILTDSAGSTLASYSQKSGTNGLVNFSHPFGTGTYYALALASDQVDLTTQLPIITLNLISATLLPPPTTKPPILTPPGDLINLLPLGPTINPGSSATIAKITARDTISIILYSLLAIGLLYLPIILWHRRLNLKLIDDQGHPHLVAKIEHYPAGTNTYPSTYQLTRDDGQIMIHGLSRGSLLYIYTPQTNISLCLSLSKRNYLIIC